MVISLSSPRFAKSTDQLVVSVNNDPFVQDTSLDGRCWFNMVNNPVIAHGYPVPKREERSMQKGLELSLGLMAGLSHADWVINFGNTLLLKGTISALVPVAEVGTSIVWHFLINPSMLEILTPSFYCPHHRLTDG
jgi:hypothetical protein